MNAIRQTALESLPENIRGLLGEFVAASRTAFDADLHAVVLYGSAAEGRWRATSDVNVILVLETFDPSKAVPLRSAMRVASSAARLRAMFLTVDEIDAAASAFAVKFADILKRRHLLYGDDPFVRLSVPRAATIVRVNQVLLNLLLRLREAWVARGLREEQLALVLAESVGPLRSCAGSMLELQGTPAPTPREALERVVTELALPRGHQLLTDLTEVRQNGVLAAGVAEPDLLAVIDLVRRMRERAQKLV